MECLTCVCDTLALDPATVMVLVNAIYFKSPWQDPFDKEDTFNMTFSRREGDDEVVPFMTKSASDVAMGRDEFLGLKWIHLPFKARLFPWRLPTISHTLS
ncbi:hypothetical protein PR048_006680 [Dryococelus australis]|uniref:Serpin domain-containing protein n=1 Tax=Dryococelus australis TaxID=614101 RepID=A0ABQ9ICY4_9NEOP|nr:hypothetical protein PR048_006680 [Dryococelus australis]